MFLVYILLFFQFPIVHSKYNSTEKDTLKMKFGCVPQENWDLFEHRDKIIENVCITRNYETHSYPPEWDHFNPIVCQLKNTKLRNVDETKKTVTINFHVLFAWEDLRIKANFVKNRNFVNLLVNTS